jgi:hypothetical protein
MNALIQRLLEGEIPDLDSPSVSSTPRATGREFYVLHKYYKKEGRVKPFRAFATYQAAQTEACKELGISSYDLVDSTEVEILQGKKGLTILYRKMLAPWTGVLTVIEEVEVIDVSESVWRPVLDSIQPYTGPTYG